MHRADLRRLQQDGEEIRRIIIRNLIKHFSKNTDDLEILYLI